MKKSRFTEAQIVGILKELDAGTTAAELGRRTAFMPIRSDSGEINTAA